MHDTPSAPKGIKTRGEVTGANRRVPPGTSICGEQGEGGAAEISAPPPSIHPTERM